MWGSLISVALSPSLSARNSSKYGQHQGGDSDWVWTTTGQCSGTLMKDMLAGWHRQLLNFPESWRRVIFTYLCLLLWDFIQSRCLKFFILRLFSFGKVQPPMEQVCVNLLQAMWCIYFLFRGHSQGIKSSLRKTELDSHHHYINKFQFGNNTEFSSVCLQIQFAQKNCGGILSSYNYPTFDVRARC